ncbi:MAG: hypothetical protein P4L41_03635 [Flavipsychrobacter sp.]|nr:hypothetical protein [Flavipsychrobacter sp.]
MEPIIIYSPTASARLTYVLDWLFAIRLQVPYVLTHNADDLPANTFFIAYGAHFIHALSVPAAGLLGEIGVRQHDITIGNWYGIPTLYAAKDGTTGYTLPFDMFSAMFFLLSRYEEYYAYTPDKHGRYPATQSELYKHGWLRRPLVDEWVHLFGEMLQSYAGITLPVTPFSFTPTYDIDIAYSYLGKGAQRNIGGLAKDMLNGRMNIARQRASVLLGNAKDPYDSFGKLAELHKTTKVSPLYFVLCALNNSAYDKNILPTHPLMVKLVKQLQADGSVFIHPSYNAQTGSVLVKEKEVLEKITSTTITSSRQHYIRNLLPNTYRVLLQHGATDDYSMGYATHIGFRAGTSHMFQWYDVLTENATPLIIHPFCFMDTAAKYEEKLDVNTAFTALHLMAMILRQNGGRLITVFHNFSLGTSSLWAGWANAYQDFVVEFARSRL